MSEIEIKVGELRRHVSDFLNDWPLYSARRIKFTSPAPEKQPEVLPDRLLRFCICSNSSTTWGRTAPDESGKADALVLKRGELVSFSCTMCPTQRLDLWVNVKFEKSLPFAPTTTLRDPSIPRGRIPIRTLAIELRKFGQVPSPMVSPKPALMSALGGKLAPLYVKGLTSLAHGFGLGALGYFRRVIDNGADDLLEMLALKAAELGEAGPERDIRQLKERGRAEDRLKQAATLLPSSMRPGGANPLMVLYDEYSKGIHRLDDKECLEVAQHFAASLDFLFSGWKTHLEEASAFQKQFEQWKQRGAPSSGPTDAEPE